MRLGCAHPVTQSAQAHGISQNHGDPAPWSCTFSHGGTLTPSTLQTPHRYPGHGHPAAARSQIESPSPGFLYIGLSHRAGRPQAMKDLGLCALIGA